MLSFLACARARARGSACGQGGEATVLMVPTEFHRDALVAEHVLHVSRSSQVSECGLALHACLPLCGHAYGDVFMPVACMRARG